MAEIVAQYRRFAASRRTPGFSTRTDRLLDLLIHGQDIVLPLGRSRPMPLPAARVVAENIWRRDRPFWARRKLAAFRLVASDIDWAAGEGAELRGPIDALLLLVSGRTAAPARPSGATRRSGRPPSSVRANTLMKRSTS